MKTAVLVLDIQRDFLSEDARMPVAKHQVGPMLHEINKMIDGAHDTQLSIIYVGNEFERTQFIPNLFRNHAAIKGTPGAMLDERLHVVNPLYFSKRIGSALTNAQLVEHLKSNHIRHLVIVGVFAEGCVLATAKHAVKSGFEVTVLRDAVASANDFKRDKALAQMENDCVHVMDTEEFLGNLTLAAH